MKLNTTKLLMLALACYLMTGCGGATTSDPSPVVEDNKVTIVCGGQTMPAATDCINVDERDSLVYGDTSSNYKGLIITLHGAPGSMEKVAGIFDATMLKQHGYLVVSPDGNGGSWEWASNTRTETSPDSHYIANLIDYMHANYTIAGDKALILGYSAGGFMAYTLACQIPEKLDGIVALAGQFRGDFNACTTTTPVAIHHLHSPSDTDVPIIGRAFGNIASVEDTVNHWTAINGCSTQFEQVEHPAVTLSSNGTLTSQWQNCAAPVSSSKLHSVPHEADYLANKLFEIYSSSMAMEY